MNQEPTTVNELCRKFGGYVEVSRKKKGRNKGYKIKYAWEWSDYRAFRRELARLFPVEMGRVECDEIVSMLREFVDCGINVTSMVASSRNDIIAIKQRYGMSNADIRPYLKAVLKTASQCVTEKTN